jgi:hypothetical protein
VPPGPVRRGHAQQFQRRDHAALEGVREADAARDGRHRVQPDERRDERGAPGLAQHPLGDCRRGRLGHEQDHLGGRIVAQRPQRLYGHPPADGLGQVPPAQADDVRDADAPPVEQGHRLLGAGTRRGDHADRPGACDVGEAEADAAEQRRAGARSHDEPVAARAVLLERDLVGDGDVVAEQQHVQITGERPVRLQCRVLARNGDHRDGTRGLPAQRVVERPGKLCRVVGGPLARREHRPLAGGEGGVERLVVGAPDGEHQVVGVGVGDVGRGDPLRQHGVQVVAGTHRDGGPLHAVDLAHRPRPGELEHRVQIRVAKQPDRGLHAAPRPATPRTIRVAVTLPPDSTTGTSRGRVMTAHPPPASRNRSDARTFGPMLPSGN